MRQRLLLLLVVGSLAAAALSGHTAMSHSRLDATSAVSRPIAPAVVTASFIPDLTCGYAPPCGLQVWSDPNEEEPCAVEPASAPNWGGCRNQDESLFVNATQIVRIYYSPNYRGAWACLPAYNNYQDVNHSNQTFNNGSGDPGYGQQVWLNVASSKFGTGSCSNPMPGGMHEPPP